jgi:hypothetical protein
MSDPRRKSRRLFIGLRIGVIVGGLAAYGVLGVRPKLEAISELDERIATRDAQAGKRRADFARVRRFVEQEESGVRDRERAVREAIPLREAAGVSDILDAKARDAGLDLLDCRVLDPIPHFDATDGGSGDKHFRVPVEATLRGRYRALPEFLAALATGSRAIRVDDLRVERDEAIFPDVRVRLTLRAFFVEPPPAEAAAGGR